MVGIYLIIVFIIALFINIPVAISLGLATTVVIAITQSLPFDFIIQSFFSAGNSFPLLAVPFFILTGDVMMEGGISKRLVNFANAFMSNITGGLGIITVFTCMIFASISGSGPATVAAIGSIMIPAMIEQKYNRSFSCALTATAGSIGPVIPPSISFVIYGVIANVSITELFMAGIIPGLLMGLALIVFTYFVSKKYKYGEKTGIKVSTKDKLKALNEAKGALMVPVIILGGIYGGIFTPTEAAIIAADYGLIMGLFVYKEITFKDLPRIFAKTSLTSGMVLILVGSATAFGRLLTIEQIPTMLANAILSISTNKIIILLLVNLFLFFVGMLIETLAAIIILAPLLLSVVEPLGVSPLHFGIIMVVNLVIGMCTPPVGVNLFVASSIGKIKIEQMFKWLIPLISVLIIVLLVITFIPGLSTFLPNLLK
jgi:C4-dicarboxylate transporter DctM subunit